MSSSGRHFLSFCRDYKFQAVDSTKAKPSITEVFGGMLSFTLKEDTMDKARLFMESVELFSLAESLGGVESLMNPLK